MSESSDKKIEPDVLRFVDAVILLGLAAMLAYVTQLVLVNITGSEELKRRNYEENFMLRNLLRFFGFFTIIRGSSNYRFKKKIVKI